MSEKRCPLSLPSLGRSGDRIGTITIRAWCAYPRTGSRALLDQNRYAATKGHRRVQARDSNHSCRERQRFAVPTSASPCVSLRLSLRILIALCRGFFVLVRV